MATVFVLIASFNRKDLTVRAVQRVVASIKRARMTPYIVVVDDRSTDGTGEALAGLSLDVRIDIHETDGSWYWARSMAFAEAAALQSAVSSDYLLWLNDDVDLAVDAVERAVEEARLARRPIVGATVDPESGEITYSGLARQGIHPLAFRIVRPPQDSVQTFNGNFVLLPVTAVHKVGGIDGGFPHGLADIDYGLRLTAAGMSARLMADPVGWCSRNARVQRTLSASWRAYVGVKGGGNYRALHRFLRRWYPRSEVVWIVATYSSWWLRRIVGRTTSDTTLT